MPALNSLYRQYRDRVAFYLVYIQEAHPIDKWQLSDNLEDDVLVRYDGITLLDPFHLKNYQSLISAIDPAGVERIEVFSGGFPVRYGTRSGGDTIMAAALYGVKDEDINALAHYLARLP